MAEAAAPVKGTRPEGAVSEADASSKVREMFTQIAPRYDLLNHLLSLHLDRIWRARTARRLQSILGRPEALVLDLCCGTGDLAFALARAGSARIVGADFAHTMLIRARKKGAVQAQPANQTTASQMPFFEADALRLPFASASFDLVTSAFGFRNLANYEAGLREIQRVLKPGGTIAFATSPIMKQACVRFSACSSPVAPSPFWNSPNHPKACGAISIVGIFAKSCRGLGDLSPANDLLTPICRIPLLAFSARPNSPHL